MPIDLYYLPGSAPCRSVQLTAKALGLELNLKPTNIMKGENLTPEFLKMNPTHTIPTLNDGGFSLWESRAIQQYLVEKYGKDDSLYPKDVKKRAVLHQRMYFDLGTLYSRFGDLYYPMMFGGAPKDLEKEKKLVAALEFLNGFLEKSKYAAGDNITIADHSLVASVSTIDSVGVDLSKYPNISRWFAECQKNMEGYQEANGDGAKHFGEWFHSMVKK